jgi:hypothetical protein
VPADLWSVTNFNIVVSVLGGWLILFGTFSHWIKETCYLSEACECSIFNRPTRKLPK